MILDSFLQFSAAQALTATAASTSYIDLGVDRNVGVGTPLSVVITLDVAADATDGNETYSAALQTDSSSAFGSAVTLGTATITRGDAAGTKYIIPLPADSKADRYLRLNYTLGGTTPTVTLTAELQPTNAIQNDYYFPRGYTVA
jgi:hypothetical protein